MQIPEEPTEETRQIPRSESGWAFRIATVSGIPIRIHFTFFLILLWIALGSQPQGAAQAVLLVIGIFACVVLHELGHAITAKHFGIHTRDITLYPIGGVAMLDGRTPKPKEEFWIALAGPAVNVVIAIGLGAALLFKTGQLPHVSYAITTTNFLEGLFAANVILPLFNMIPAFPMDGGRVLRAVLAMSMPEARATRIAGDIGQLLAIIFGIVGVFNGSLVLMLIAFFVFLGAHQEVNATVGRSIVSGHKMSDAMLTSYRTLESGQTLEGASKALLEGSQQDFPVTLGEQVLGILTRDSLIRGLALEGPTAYVSGHMFRDFRSADPDAPLQNALDLFSSGDTTPILIMEAEKLLGMVTRDNFGEFLMLEQVRNLNRRRRRSRA